jgi:hypothetical protein
MAKRRRSRPEFQIQGSMAPAVAVIAHSLTSCSLSDLFAEQIGPRIAKDWADYIGPNLSRSQRVTTNRVLTNKTYYIVIGFI